jgi:hypothetical protein
MRLARLSKLAVPAFLPLVPILAVACGGGAENASSPEGAAANASGSEAQGAAGSLAKSAAGSTAKGANASAGSAAQSTVRHSTAITGGPPAARIWLSSSLLARLQQRAAGNDAGWSTLKARCDADASGTVEIPSGDAYPNAPNIGQGYQGDGYFPEILALGLCYRTAHGVDDASAARWAAAGSRVLAAMATPAGSGGQTPSTDDGYGIRNYGIGMAIGYDWLSPALDASTRAAVASALDAWIAWYDASGFSRNEPIGNYFAAYLFAKGAAAIALEGSDANADTWWTDVTTHLWGQLAGPAYKASLVGGGWPEGWQYGPLSVRNVVGFLWAANTGKGQSWWTDVPLAQGEAEYIGEFAWPSRKHMDDRGTVHAQKVLPPSASTVAMMATVLDAQGDAFAATAHGIASDIDAATGEVPDPWQAFLFWDSGAASAPASGLPTSYFTPGPNHVAMRSSWDTNATWASFVSGQYIDAPDSGEQYFDEGSLAVASGDAPVLVNATGWLPQAAGDDGENFVYDDTWGSRTRLLNNTFYVAGAVQGGGDPTESTTHIERYEDGGTYVRARGAQLEQQYTSGAVNQWVRDVAYVRPGRFVVYDRTTVPGASTDQWMAWHVPGTPARSASADGTPRFDVGGGTIRALLPRGANASTVGVLNAVTRIEVHAPAASQDWLTAITVGESPEVVRLSAADGNVISGSVVGAHVAGGARESVVLFAADHAAAAPSSGAEYVVTQTAAADHVIFDLVPGGYAVTATPTSGALHVHVTPGGSVQTSAGGTLSFSVSPSGEVTTATSTTASAPPPAPGSSMASEDVNAGASPNLPWPRRVVYRRDQPATKHVGSTT